MRLLLISDTHGNLELLNRLVSQNSCDAVVHAGDLGFYDHSSPDRMTEREIMLQIMYSKLNEEKKLSLLQQDLDEQRRFLKGEHSLSDLTRLLNGTLKLDVPVYAVWGNHEDIAVINKFISGSYNIENLHLLHEKSIYQLDNLLVYGLGGNLLLGKKFFQRPIAGGGGKVWSVISQYRELLRTIEKNANSQCRRMFVSHVSPGKEAFVSIFGIHSMADVILSGHMGAPVSMAWRDFDIRTIDESETRLHHWFDTFETEWIKVKDKIKRNYQPFVDQLKSLPPRDIKLGRGEIVPWWYKGTQNINLPDAEVGYAILETKTMKFITN